MVFGRSGLLTCRLPKSRSPRGRGNRSTAWRSSNMARLIPGDDMNEAAKPSIQKISEGEKHTRWGGKKDCSESRWRPRYAAPHANGFVHRCSDFRWIGMDAGKTRAAWRRRPTTALFHRLRVSAKSRNGWAALRQRPLKIGNDAMHSELSDACLFRRRQNR